MRHLTTAADWLTKFVGLDDQYHHGISFSKVVIVWFAWCLGVAIMSYPMSWVHMIALVALVAAALSRAKFDKFLDLLQAKWSATATDATTTTIDMAQTITALQAKTVTPPKGGSDAT